MKEQCRQEILDLHRFFEEWFAGRLPESDEAFARATVALGEAFVLVSPNGRLTDRHTLMNGLRGEHNGRSHFRIWIEKFQLQQQQGDIAIATYEEWQEIGDTVTSRQSTAVFQQDFATPNGVKWLHVHETWIE
ncbi:MAG: hypothetical protein R3C62_13455 [Chloroflexota bacterium]